MNQAWRAASSSKQVRRPSPTTWPARRRSDARARLVEREHAHARRARGATSRAAADGAREHEVDVEAVARELHRVVRRSRRRPPRAAGPGSGRPRARAGYRSPVPLRVAFLGPAATFGAHALHAPADGVEPFFVDPRRGATRRVDVAPHVVIALAPDGRAPATERRDARRDRPGRPGARGLRPRPAHARARPRAPPGARARCRSTTASTATRRPSSAPAAGALRRRGSTAAARVDPHARQARPRRRPLHARARRATRWPTRSTPADVGIALHADSEARLPVPGAAAPRRRPPAADRAPAARAAASSRASTSSRSTRATTC